MQLTLGQLINRLEAFEDKSKVVLYGFGPPASYRGCYDQLAFEPAGDVTVGEMLGYAKSAVGHTFVGYKGGEFKMDEDTPVWIADYGASGEQIGELLLGLMLDSARRG